MSFVFVDVARELSEFDWLVVPAPPVLPTAVGSLAFAGAACVAPDRAAPPCPLLAD